ncbi:MAG: outer membrane protein assembly factor BamA [Candidatus Dasytiphilus stammeri]
MVIKFWLIIILLIFSSKMVISGTNQFVIKNIYFKGLQRITINAVLLTIPIRVGDLVSQEDISNTIRALFFTKYFDNVEILRNRNILIIKLKERPLINQIIISGNKLLGINKIKNILEDYGIKVGNFLDLSKINIFERNMENSYYLNGNYTAQVKFIVKSLSDQWVKIKIIFEEGKLANINNIMIVGNQNFSYKKLIKIFDTVSAWHFINHHQYPLSKLSLNLEKLRNFYMDHGYIHFKVNSAKIFFNPEKQVINVTIYISEGARYKIKKIIFNNEFFSNNLKIKNLAILHNGEWYNRNKIKNTENLIKDFLENNGYAWPYVVTRIIIKETDKTLQLIINIYPGQRYYVHRIFFQGNNLTKDSILRRELRQIEGIFLNKSIVYQDQERLNYLGYFESVNVNIISTPGTTNQVDIIYQVKERNIGSINFGIEFNSKASVNYQTDFSQNNWLGTGYKISLSGQRNIFKNSTEFIVTNPFFTVKGISIGEHIFYKYITNPDLDAYQYSYKNYGISENLDFKISKHNIIDIGIGYITHTISHMPAQLAMWRSLNIGSMSDGNYQDNAFTFQLGWRYKNIFRKIFSMYGNHSQLHGTLYLNKINNIYYRVIFDSGQYLPMKHKNKWIIFIHGQIGYSGGINIKESPLFENFYAGGLTSVRGFTLKSIGPKAVYYHSIMHSCNQKPLCISNDTIGGNVMAIASIELISPVYNLVNLGAIRSSLFLDLGSIWDSKWANNYQIINYEIHDYRDPINNLRVSSGVSIQWMSILGPITLSYSKPITHYKGDKIESFQFRIGTSSIN